MHNDLLHQLVELAGVKAMWFGTGAIMGAVFMLVAELFYPSRHMRRLPPATR